MTEIGSDRSDLKGASERIGFVGLGRMGRPMAARLVQAGYEVRSFDVSVEARDAAADEAGVVPVAEATDVADGSSVIILMLPNSDVIEDVLIERRLLDACSTGMTIIDMSSSQPLRTRALAKRAAQRGITLMDAPVSGGVAGARSGSLTIMVGGTGEQLRAVELVLQPLGKRIVRVGDVGAGHATKALNNLLSATHLLATSEAMLAAKAFGLDLELVLDAINGSSGRSGSTEVKWPKHILSGGYDSGFALDLMVKDMAIAVSLEQDLNVPGSLGAAALSMWRAAGAALGPGADHTEIVHWLEQS